MLRTKMNNSKMLAKLTYTHTHTHTHTTKQTPIKTNNNKKNLEETNIEVGRVALDAEFDVLGLNLAIELLRRNVWRKIYVHVTSSRVWSHSNTFSPAKKKKPPTNKIDPKHGFSLRNRNQMKPD